MVFRVFPALLAAGLASAQTVINYSALPSCAQQCTLLTSAQTGCVPPAAPVTNQATYQSCFCQSAYLRTLYTTPNGVCDAFCDQTDLVTIQQWYIGLCQSGTVAAAPAPASTVAGVSPVGSTPSTSASTQSSGGSSTSSSSSWWGQHWKWILMVIILLIGFAVIIWVGVYLKRRHIRKRNQAASMAPPVVWGPHQNQAHTRGYDYPRKSLGEKDKTDKYRPEAAPTSPPVAQTRSSERKLKKILGR